MISLRYPVDGPIWLRPFGESLRYNYAPIRDPRFKGAIVVEGTTAGLTLYERDGGADGFIIYSQSGELRLNSGEVDLVALTTAGALSVAGGLDVTGEVRGDSLRIDAAPSASAATATHKLAVNLDGSTYYLLLSNV